ncbi:hypothetical protein B0H13DRAFT_1922137 [Mycena leptocephala]|nr:hypothetical protein B0H13DRAFT_1922137 [Mycena leptocephala]
MISRCFSPSSLLLFNPLNNLEQPRRNKPGYSESLYMVYISEVRDPRNPTKTRLPEPVVQETPWIQCLCSGDTSCGSWFISTGQIQPGPSRKLRVEFTGIVIAVIFLISLLRRRNLGRALRSASQSGATAPGIWLSLPILAIPIFTALGAVKWLCYLMGFFPISGISILEMYQIAAPLPIVVVAAIRTLGPLLKHRGGVTAAGPEEASVVPGAFTVDANKRVPAPVVDQEIDVADTERSWAW